jgi:hypothetical protein
MPAPSRATALPNAPIYGNIASMHDFSNVIPAKAGIQSFPVRSLARVPRFRGGDGNL